MIPSPHAPALPNLNELVDLFYETPASLGVLDRVDPQQMPADYRRLLDHHSHMTVTVEQYHGSLVDLEVLQTRVDQQRYYSRKILLRRHDNGQVVQFGIVRLDLDKLQPAVRAAIEARQTPLGHVLIQHNVLRQVQLAALWKVLPGPELRGLLNCPAPLPTYGRTAMIYCDGEPAVELLEIVAPV